MPKAIPAETRELAKALFIQGCKFAVISQQTGVTPALLRTWAHRFKWHDLLTQATQPLTHRLQRGLIIETQNSLQAMGEQIRQSLAAELAAQVQLLAANPARDIRELATTKGTQGRASVVKTIVETAAQVHGWETAGSAGLVLVGELSQEPTAPDPAPPVDIAATVTPAELAAPAAPPDTPSGSVPEEPQTLSQANPLSLQG